MLITITRSCLRRETYAVLPDHGRGNPGPRGQGRFPEIPQRVHVASDRNERGRLGTRPSEVAGSARISRKCDFVRPYFSNLGRTKS